MNKQKGFTIVELLTSIVIIALLLGLLLPSLAKIRRSAKEAAQKAQITVIDTALDAFRQDYGDYPPSDQYNGIGNTTGLIYCGAQKLTEALLGWDLMGFHPQTRFMPQLTRIYTKGKGHILRLPRHRYFVSVKVLPVHKTACIVLTIPPSQLFLIKQ
jgi:prepilin-type N-terminal cleavage/methylation domain-containing protein